MDDKALAELAALGEIAGEIVHELRNALLVISASTYLAQKSPADCAPHLQKIERHTRIAQAVVDGMMALARNEAVATEPTLLGDVLSAARAGVGGEANFVDDVEGCTLQAHPTLLSRVFRCLFENSAQASAPVVPTIRTCVEVGERAVITVSDDGPGVPATIADRLFEPLVTARMGGTGLGLALARRIVTAHHGTIELAGTKSGAMFRITLPRARSPVGYP